MLTIDSFILIVGIIAVVGGGICLAIAIVGGSCYLACIAWVAFSNRFRSICKAESLIYEYRKNREEFMAWKTAREVLTMANEKRLIDANRLSLEFIARFCGADTALPFDMQIELKQLIDEQPTVDAVEVVRCDDCLRFDFPERENCPIAAAKRYRALFPMPFRDDFCSYGEKREVE